MAASTVHLAVRLEARLKQSAEDCWVAACPAIDVATQADSRKAALLALHEAVEAWFESTIERGVLDQALREVGFAPARLGDPPTAPDETGDFIEVSIPAYAAAELEDLPLAAG